MLFLSASFVILLRNNAVVKSSSSGSLDWHVLLKGFVYFAKQYEIGRVQNINLRASNMLHICEQGVKGNS